jgi:zinc/manganese transport system substrate-binding protein
MLAGAGLVAVLLAAGTGCSPAPESRSTEPPVGGLCPVAPIDVVVSVDQWGSIVEQLAGSCATVTSIVSGGSVDPHDYEPTPSDAAAMARADLIVLNGVGYDEWAQRAVDARSPRPPVLDIGGRFDIPAGTDPHLWYAPGVVRMVLDDITAALTGASPDAADFFAARAVVVKDSMSDYFATIGRLRTAFEKTQGGVVTFAATEPVFDTMAATLGMVDVTPAGFARAVSNEGEPSPGDVGRLMDALADGSVAVLIVNVQSASSMTDRLREQAETHDVAILEVTETMASGSASFQDWQVGQLQALADALGFR